MSWKFFADIIYDEIKKQIGIKNIDDHPIINSWWEIPFIIDDSDSQPGKVGSKLKELKLMNEVL